MSLLHLPIFLKRCVATLFYHAGVPHTTLKQRASSQYLILMYHRILPAASLDDAVEPGMYVSTESFTRQVNFLSQRFTLAPLAELIAGNTTTSKKPLCAITFDDGWLDFYHHAFPVLQRFQAPATVFIPTNFIGTERAFWTDSVARLVSQKHALQQSLASPALATQLNDNIVVRSLFRTENSVRDELGQLLGRLKHRRADEIYKALDQLTSLWPTTKPDNRSFLNWDELRTLHASGLVTFGSHTAEHTILTTLQDEEVHRELLQSKERLLAERVVDQDQPLWFCYPNGNASNKIAKMVENTGYAGAVTTKKGWNAWGTNRFRLNRIGMHEDMSSTPAMFACRLAGLL